MSKLLEKETLRRPDLEAIFDDIEPERPELPLHDVRFTRQKDHEPVKTPVELALERGEEPPKRFSILEASRETRERRRREREAEQAQQNQPYNRWRAGHNGQPGQPGQPGHNGQGGQPGHNGQGGQPGHNGHGGQPGGPNGSTRWEPNRGSQPNYGPTPPPGWTYPGQPGQPPAQQRPGQPPAQAQAPQPQHPGMDHYRPGEETAQLPRPRHAAPEQPAQPAQPTQQPNGPEAPTEEIGFRLPEHERPDHPFEEDATRPDVPEEAPARDADEIAKPDTDAPEPPHDDTSRG